MGESATSVDSSTSGERRWGTNTEQAKEGALLDIFNTNYNPDNECARAGEHLV